MANTYEWQPADTGGQQGKSALGETFPVPVVQPGGPTFDLYYFEDPPLDGQDSKYTIAFCSGGPGEIAHEAVLPKLRDARVIYFHLRGSGGSKINLSHDQDQYLRTDFAVEDLEKLREKVLGDKAWDAIVGQSHGTMIAHQYAAKYEGKVKRLVLSAPPSRHGLTNPGAIQDFINKRREKRLLTLREIYRGGHFNLDRAKEDLIVEGAGKVLKTIERPFRTAWIMLRTHLAESNTLFFAGLPASFTSKADVEARLRQEFGGDGRTVHKVETFQDDNGGWLGFVTMNDWDEALKAMNALNGERIEGSVISVHTRAFFRAFRQVRRLGWKTDKVRDLARVIGAELSKGEFGSDQELKAARDRYNAKLSEMNRKTRSLRARFCFAINDGLSANFLWAQANTNGGLHDAVEKSGGEAGLNHWISSVKPDANRQAINPWDPAHYQHSIPTLILQGEADAITLPEQSRHFYENGLTGPRMMITFQGMGHLWPRCEETKELIESFLKGKLFSHPRPTILRTLEEEGESIETRV